MKYSDTLRWMHAIWKPDSPEANEANEVVEETVESILADQYTYATLHIHLKGGRSLSMRAWVDKDDDITEHNLWKGLTEWLNDMNDNTPYFFNSDGGNYHTYIVKSEVAQLELRTEKDEK